jgi:hypothetical protein
VTTIDVTPVDESQTRSASSVAPSEAVANIVSEGLDPVYQGMPATRMPAWLVYAMIALALYFLWGED